MTAPVLLPTLDGMTSVAHAGLTHLVQHFAEVRRQGEFTAIAVELTTAPPPTPIIMMFEGDADERATTVAMAASILRGTTRPAEAAVLADSYFRTHKTDGPLSDEAAQALASDGSILDVLPRDDPQATEALMITYASAAQVRTIALPYGWDDAGRLIWRAPERWVETSYSPMSTAIGIAVGREPQPPPWLLAAMCQGVNPHAGLIL